MKANSLGSLAALGMLKSLLADEGVAQSESPYKEASFTLPGESLVFENEKDLFNHLDKVFTLPRGARVWVVLSGKPKRAVFWGSCKDGRMATLFFHNDDVGAGAMVVPWSVIRLEEPKPETEIVASAAESV